VWGATLSNVGDSRIRCDRESNIHPSGSKNNQKKKKKGTATLIGTQKVGVLGKGPGGEPGHHSVRDRGIGLILYISVTATGM